MKWKRMSALVLAVAVLASTGLVAQTPKPTPTTTAPAQTTNEDLRISKILEQNEKVLKNQEAILKALTNLQQDVTVLKFRSH